MLFLDEINIIAFTDILKIRLLSYIAKLRNSKLLDFAAIQWYTVAEVIIMNTNEIILKLRTARGLSQDELAEKVYVTRQAVSRWENGETVPNTDTLKLLSAFFDVSINTLLGTPRKLFCQCCGMPLDDGSISRETDGSFNEEYCKWCYTDGKFAYPTIDSLVDYLVEHFPGSDMTEDQARSRCKEALMTLNHWKSAK